MIDVKDLIAEHTLMYGVEFDHDVVLSRYRNCIMNHDAVGAYENDALIGICTQYYWETMPVWTFSNMFLKSSDNAYMSKKMIQTLGGMTEHCIMNAEKKEVNEWINSLVDAEYHPSVSKNELLETIKSKLAATMQPMPGKAKIGHNGTKEFMTYESSPEKAEPDVAPEVIPSEPDVDEPKKRPSHPGKRPTDPNQNPLPDPVPQAKHKKHHKHKKDVKEISAKDAQAKVIGAISKILKK